MPVPHPHDPPTGNSQEYFRLSKGASLGEIGPTFGNLTRLFFVIFYALFSNIGTDREPIALYRDMLFRWC